MLSYIDGPQIKRHIRLRCLTTHRGRETGGVPSHNIKRVIWLTDQITPGPEQEPQEPRLKVGPRPQLPRQYHPITDAGPIVGSFPSTNAVLEVSSCLQPDGTWKIA